MKSQENRRKPKETFVKPMKGNPQTEFYNNFDLEMLFWGLACLPKFPSGSPQRSAHFLTSSCPQFSLGLLEVSLGFLGFP